MKILHIITMLCIVNLSPLYAMKNIIQKTKNIIKKTNINDIAFFSTFGATGLTGNPVFLLPIIPKFSHDFAKDWHALTSKERSESKINSDLEFLIKISPLTVDLLKTFKKTTQEIEYLEDQYNPIRLKALNLTKELTTYNQRITGLKQIKMASHNCIIQQTASLFKTHPTLDISQALENNEYHLRSLKIARISTQCLRPLALPLAHLPIICRTIYNNMPEETLSDPVDVANVTMSLLIVSLLALLEESWITTNLIETLPSLIQVPVALSLLLSMGASYKNWNAANDMLAKINEEQIILEQIKEVLKIQETHIKNQNLQ